MASRVQYIEVTVNVDTFQSTCPCRKYNEDGLICAHVKALLLRLGCFGVGHQWYHKRYYTETFAASYQASVSAMCVSGKLNADVTCLPPDHKRSAGRPTKKRKERSSHTNKSRQCKACGGDGHFAIACPFPSTEYRYNQHKERALKWCKANESASIE